MKNLESLKMLMIKELDEMGEKGELDVGTLDVVDKLAHATKNLCKVIKSMDEYSGYDGTDRMSNRMSRRSYADDSAYADEESYARGRMNAPRDSMGRYSGMRGYSRHGEDKAIEVLDDLRGIVRELPKDAKYEVERIIKKHEDVYAK